VVNADRRSQDTKITKYADEETDMIVMGTRAQQDRKHLPGSVTGVVTPVFTVRTLRSSRCGRHAGRSGPCRSAAVRLA